MPTYSRVPRRRMSAAWMILFGLGILVFGGLGTVGTLWAMGIVELPFLKSGPDYAGLVPVPASAVAIPAYAMVTRDHVIDAQKKRLSYVYLPPEQVRPTMKTSLADIIGRVLKDEKPAGYVFTEKDFLPEGTRPGLVGGIPEGKRAMTLEAEKLRGIQSLKAGDHFDILSTIALNSKNAQRPTAGGLLGVVGGGTTGRTDLTPKANVTALVQGGVVVMPVTTRQVPSTSASLTQGRRTVMVPIQEVVIAVDPEEVAGLSEALALGAEIMCVARLGRPDEEGEASITPGSPPRPKPTVVEVVVGKKLERVEIPTALTHADPGTTGAGTQAIVP